MKKNNLSLASYLDYLQSMGRYTFTKKEALGSLNVSTDAFRFAALRLIKKKRLVRPKQSFYVIVPTEYRNAGAPPISWFIDDLMKFYKQPYYVGLLSAAFLYGAAHQQPQIFQVITNKPLRPIKKEEVCIEFSTKKQIAPTSYKLVKTFTGYMSVSTPEVTAIDLMRYVKSSGYLSNVVTVLNELQENFDEQRFLQALKTERIELPCIQRLGYLLQFIGSKMIIVSLLKKWLKKQKPHLVPLRPDNIYKKSQINTEWNLYINEKIEVDV